MMDEKKTEILKNDKDQVIVERNYYRNKRYIEKIRYPDGFLFSTQVYIFQMVHQEK